MIINLIKYLLNRLIVLLLLSINTQAQWNLQYSQSGELLNCVYFVDYNNGWAVGGRFGVGALIINTTDGGTTWNDNLVIPGTTNLFNSVYFTDVSNGWVVGDGGVMMQTTNAGNSWDTVFIPTDAYLHQIQFVDSNYGWAAGTEDNLSAGIILKTTNAGLNWEGIDIGSENLFISIYYLNQNLGWGSGGKIKKTTDGGYNWVTMNDSSGGSSIYFADDFNGWAVGASDTGPNGYINRTTDGGITWDRISGSDIPGLQSVAFFDINVGWAVGFGTSTPIIKTTDGGVSWFHQEGGSIAALNSVFIIDSVTGWSTGNGSILKTSNGGVTFINEDETEEIPTRFNLDQNYPNPFNPSTKIRWQTPVGSWQSLMIYDVLGNEVATLVDEYKPAGNYNIEWAPSALPSGVYFYQLKTEGFVETRKMILMK